MHDPSGKYRHAVAISAWATTCITALGLLFKTALLGADLYPFNSDEAIVALMARHILGGEWPVFFYGQAYMGSLDASLVALGFGLFGQHVWVVRLVQLILFTGLLLSSMHLAWRLSGSRLSSLVTGMLLAIPTVNLNLYSTVSLGGYGEALLIGNLLLILTVEIRERYNAGWQYLIWGLAAGIGFWAFGLTLIYSLPAFIYLLLTSSEAQRGERSGRWIAWLLAGAMIGLTPILYWISTHGIAALVRELFGSAISGTSGGSYWSEVSQHVINLLLFGIPALFGFRAPWNVQIFLWPLAVISGLFWLAVLTNAWRVLRYQNIRGDLGRLLFSASGLLLLGFILTPFGGDPSGRYFLPLTIVACILAGLLFNGDAEWIPRWSAWLLFACAFSYQFVSNMHVALRSESGFTTQFDPVARIDHGYDDALIQFLDDHDEHYGYTNYWVSYPLAFHSEEEIIFIPRLPYHQDLRYTPRDNRYEAYNPIVQRSSRVAYITTNNPGLDGFLRARFNQQNLLWSEAEIGDFRIFYELSEPLRPGSFADQFLE